MDTIGAAGNFASAETQPQDEAECFVNIGSEYLLQGHGLPLAVGFIRN